MNTLFRFFILCFFVVVKLQAQITICSWNIENIGKSKSDEDINFIANTVRNYDVVAIQEVVAGYGGVQAIAKLADELNRKGARWDYTVSNPTTSSSYKTERYAFLWKTHRVKIKKTPWLEEKYKLEIDREPFYATFMAYGKEFTLVNFHAITKEKQPEREIKYFKFLPQLYPDLNLIFLGDFNCPQSHTVFNPLKSMGFDSVFKNQKTSLKKSCSNDTCLASEFDNIWYDTNKIEVLDTRAIKFYESFESLEKARSISDHIPIMTVINFISNKR